MYLLQVFFCVQKESYFMNFVLKKETIIKTEDNLKKFFFLNYLTLHRVLRKKFEKEFQMFKNGTFITSK